MSDQNTTCTIKTTFSRNPYVGKFTVPWLEQQQKSTGLKIKKSDNNQYILDRQHLLFLSVSFFLQLAGQRFTTRLAAISDDGHEKGHNNSKPLTKDTSQFFHHR